MTQRENLDTLIQSLASQLRDMFAPDALSTALMIGIRTGGVWVAQALHEALGLDTPVGELDISFYRDDFTRIGLNPTVRPSQLPTATENRDIILVDDVIMSGRTVRAAMNEIFDFGRPASITLVALIDVGHRELPIQPQVTGKQIELAPGEQVKLTGPSPLSLEIRKKSGER